MTSVDLVSMGRQDSVRFSMTEAQLATAGTLSITVAPAPQQNATTHSFALLPFQIVRQHADFFGGSGR